jgi:hypothetical protein
MSDMALHKLVLCFRPVFIFRLQPAVCVCCMCLAIQCVIIVLCKGFFSSCLKCGVGQYDFYVIIELEIIFKEITFVAKCKVPSWDCLDFRT